MNNIYPYFDAHCDTLTKIYKEKSSLNTGRNMLCLSHLKDYSDRAVVFAVYNDGTLNRDDIISHIDYLKSECKIFSHYISFEDDFNSIVKNNNNKIITAFASIENLGGQKDFEYSDVLLYKNLGIRIMSLCHNEDNRLCGGAANNKTGITSLGKNVLRIMQKERIVLDVSHMSDTSFWESLGEYSLPPLASHSNSRMVCNNSRNLTDSQFVYLVKRGGVCGINFCPEFVSDKMWDIDSVTAHIEHFMELGGENAICIGADFDGIDKTCKNLENASCVYNLFNRLLSINYNESLINKIAFNNFHNFTQKFETLE